MKIEIDLNELLGDEYGQENLSESIRRQITESLVADYKKTFSERAQKSIQKKIDSEIGIQLEKEINLIIKEGLEKEYEKVGTYGSPGGKTTIKEEIIKGVQAQTTYKNTTYSSDKNMFTKAVDEAVKAELSKFQKDFTEQVTDMFTEKAMEYAVKELEGRIKRKAS